MYVINEYSFQGSCLWHHHGRCRRAASEFGPGSWWPDGAWRRFFRLLLYPLPAAPTAARCTYPKHLSVITPSHHSLEQYTVVDSPRASHPTKRPNSSRVTPRPHQPQSQQGISSIPQQQLHHQRVCCDHQLADRCSVRESPTRPRSSPLRLDPQASPDGAERLPLHPAISHITQVRSLTPDRTEHFLTRAHRHAV
jgi:hypothetical protein